MEQLGFQRAVRPGGEALQMVGKKPGVLQEWDSGGSRSLEMPDHRAPRMPTFCCLCSLESLDEFSLQDGGASPLEPSEATTERMG